jgi:ABC-type transporter Mla subunit MlaD
MVGIPSNIATLDQRIAAVRENLRELIEQAAAYSGAADDDLASRRIAEQEALLARLVNERDMELVQMEPSWNRTARIK